MNNLKDYAGRVKDIGFEVTTNNHLIMICTGCDNSIYYNTQFHTSAIVKITYYDSEKAEVETLNSIYHIEDRASICLIRFLYESGSYRDKCEWEFVK